MRVGIIGFGYWGATITRKFLQHPQVEQVTVTDANQARIGKAKEMFSSIETVNTPDALFEDEKIDLIVVVTPIRTHYALAKAALESGKHVLVEKSMTASLEQAVDLVKIAKRKGKVLAVDHTFVYSPAVQKIKQLIQKNELGDLWYYDSIRVNLGLFQHDVNVLWDLAAHDLALVLHLTEKLPVEVAVQGSSHTDNGIIDIAYMTLKYANGFMSHFHVNWLAPTKIRQVTIGGSNKMLIWDDLNPSEKLRIYDKGIEIQSVDTSKEEALHKLLIKYRSGDMLAPSLDTTETLTILIEQLLQAIEKKVPLQTPGEQGVQVVSILEAAERSLNNAGRLEKIYYPEY